MNTQNAIRNMQTQLDSTNAKIAAKQFTTDEPQSYLLGVRNATVYHLQLFGVYGFVGALSDNAYDHNIPDSELTDEAYQTRMELRAKTA